MTDVNPIPDGFHTLTPYLVVKDCAKAIDFYKRAFGAKALYCNTCEQSGLVLNAQLQIGDSMLMLNDEFPEFGCIGPSLESPSSVCIHIYVDNVDAFFRTAIDAGCEPTMPLNDTFWGDRFGKLTDPYHHSWSVATRVEDLSPEEIQERSKHAFPNAK